MSSWMSIDIKNEAILDAWGILHFNEWFQYLWELQDFWICSNAIFCWLIEDNVHNGAVDDLADLLFRCHSVETLKLAN